MTDDLNRRVSSLEQWREKEMIERARSDERRIHMDARFDRVEGRLDKMDGHLNKLVWLILAAIIGGFMTFIIRGGLTIVG